MLCCPTIGCLGSTCIKVSRLGCIYVTVTPEDVLIFLTPLNSALALILNDTSGLGGVG
jgi:hypothetical protein